LKYKDKWKINRFVYIDMTKQTLETLTRERLKECEVLLNNKCYSGAYYLAGYSVEFALKACIAKQINQHQIPEKSFVNEFYVHDLKRLVRLAGLETERSDKEQNDTDFAINWGVVKD
jgi:HEPN domain-containing protein